MRTSTPRGQRADDAADHAVLLHHRLRDQRDARDGHIEQGQLLGQERQAAGAVDDVLDGLEVVGLGHGEAGQG